MEKTVHLKRWETYSNSKYSFQYANLFHVVFLHAKAGWFKVRAYSKGFSMGQWGSCEKTSLSKVEDICLGKSKGGLGIRCLSMMNKALLCKWI